MHRKESAEGKRPRREGIACVPNGVKGDSVRALFRGGVSRHGVGCIPISSGCLRCLRGDVLLYGEKLESCNM